jgi:hypothetical protein
MFNVQVAALDPVFLIKIENHKKVYKMKMESSCSQIILRCRTLMCALSLVVGAMFSYPVLMAENQDGVNRDMTADPPAVIRDFSGGAPAEQVMTVDFFVYGSDGLCVPGLVCGGSPGVTYKLPGEDKERGSSIALDGTYKGRTFDYVLNSVNMSENTACARGFQPGDDCDPDPNKTLPATRLANRLLINPEALFKRFMVTFEAVEGIRPIPTGLTTGMEVYPRGAGDFKKKIIPNVTDTRYYSIGASPHVKFVSCQDGKVIKPYGNHVALSCILWRRSEHADFTAGEAVDLMGNRLPASGIAAWGWQSGYGGLQYGDYQPGLGMHFFPALALGESWDIRYNGDPHVMGDWQQEQPCWYKPLGWGRYIYAGKAFNSEYAPVAFGRIVPRKERDPARPTQQVMVFGDPNAWYAPQDAFNYDDDKLTVMKWSRQGKGTARIVRGGYFFQGGAAMLFPGTDVPNSLRKPIVTEGLQNITLTVHWFSLPAEGYDPNGSFLAVEFANAPRLTISAGQDGQLSVSRPDKPDLKTGLSLKTGWNALDISYDQESKAVFIRLGKDYAVDKDRRMKFPAEGGMTALEIGKNAAPSDKGNVLFDAIWINPNDNLSDNFEYASLSEMGEGKTWKTNGTGISLDASIAYSGRQALKIKAGAKPVTLARPLLQDLRDHTVQLAWNREATRGDDSYVELRSGDGKESLRLRGNEQGMLLYRTENADWIRTNLRFRPEYLANWHELTVIFDADGNAYLRLNGEWVAQANGQPLVIPNRGTLSMLELGRTGAVSGSDVCFDDLRVLRNFKLVGTATLYSSTFEYPLDADACLKQLGWNNAAAACARLEYGKGATAGRRCLLLPGNAPADTPVSRSFDPELRDVTAEFSWYHNPDENKQADVAYGTSVDSGFVRLSDAKGNRLTLSADEKGVARYRINDQAWRSTDYKLVNGWNKSRVVIGENKPLEFWMAPQRKGIHPKEQWKLITVAVYTNDSVKTDYCQKVDTVFSGLSRVEIGRNVGSKDDFLFDDLFVLTNKPSERTRAQPDFGNNRITLPNELDNRLANRDWTQIEKVLIEKGFVKAKEKAK